ncbi:MAG: glucose-1-phosphate adenylyltransferase [Deltaproteobacteria bacterium]|nr:glucose-1-phosphate adenylyltransferase [Deltaproteobacteria bacterium]
MARPRILTFVMAGGKGERLYPLTKDRSKPAVPFGGRYRIIDFVLSNLYNSGLGAVYVLTQYKAQSLVEHLETGWTWRGGGRDGFIRAVPAQMKLGELWYRGTADAIFQNLNLVRDYGADIVLVFSADHIYKMNVRQMLDFHLRVGAAATVSCLPVPRAGATQFGVVAVDEQWRIKGFIEKPVDPPPIPGLPEESLASMGNYIFNVGLLQEVLGERRDGEPLFDFGKDILPAMTVREPVYAYDFRRNRIPGLREGEQAYWRDVGTIEAYYEANMDLKNVVPLLNLYNWQWPIMTARFHDPPCKFVFDEDGRRGVAVQSVMASGCLLSGGYVKDSVLGRNVVVDAGAQVRESVLMDNVVISPGARVRRAIIDKNVVVAPGEVIGEDFGNDCRRYVVSATGIVVVEKAPDTPETLARNW